MSEHRQMTSSEVKSALTRCFEVQRPAFIWGPPGIGKSELVEGITKDMNGLMIDLRLGQMEPTDVRGMPFFNRDIGKMDWAPPIDLPDEELASRYPVVVLFLDEMNTAPPSVLAAAYQLILNRGIGRYKLPDNVVMVAAGNRESDKGVSFRMPTPLSNRFIHFEMKVDYDSWLEWAVTNKIHKDVVGYIGFAKNDLYDFDPKSNSRAFATPRSWTFVSELISGDNLDHGTMVDLVSGTIGQGLALKFEAHRKVASKMPKPSNILNGNVTKLEINEVSAMYSLVVSMCYELQESQENDDVDELHSKFDNFIGFMMANFETELIVMGARVAITTYNISIQPRKLSNFADFNKKYGKYIINVVRS